MAENNSKRLISLKEIREHHTPQNAWIVIHNKVYDISKWENHPGGSVMYTQAGEDATDAFAVFHPSSALKYLNEFYIGDVDTSSKNEPLSEEDVVEKKKVDDFLAAYRKLRIQVKSLGFYDASLTYYVWKGFSTFALWLLSASMCMYFQSFGMYMVAGSVMGLFWQQSGWYAHDFAHQQVCKNRLANNLVVLVVGNIWQGFSLQWWKNKHNTHHAITNLHADSEDCFIGDPDINTMPLLAWSKKMASMVDSTTSAFFIRHQAVLYFPLLLFARLSWLAQSFSYVFQQTSFGPYDSVEYPLLEKIALLIHYGWNIAVPYYAGMTLIQGVCFFLMASASCGFLLALVFSLGHNGMHVYDRDEKPDFWRLQVTTTRNVTSSWFIDWFTGGLNYQIDHHLFPRVPRHHFGKLNKLVRSLCEDYDIPYYETGFWEGLKEVVVCLDSISKEFIHDFPAM